MNVGMTQLSQTVDVPAQGRVDAALDVSVVIPAYNAAETLGETIGTLQQQTFTGTWEAIVVDDGSTDATAEVARALAAADPRITFIQKENSGVSATRNRGLREASNAWILFLDADDLLVPEALELFMGEVARQPDLQLVYGGWCRLLPDGRLFDEVRDVPADDLFRSFSGTCAFAIHACVTRRDLILGAGGFDESLITCEDWDLWQRVARGGPRAVEIPRRMAIYRMRPQSASNNGVQMLADGLVVIDRGHGEDPRVVEPAESYRAGAERRMQPLAKLGMAAYCAGLVVGRGGDPEPVLSLVEDLRPTISDPDAVGSTIAAAVPLGRAKLAGDWPTFEPELWARVDALLHRFETIAAAPYFARRARKGFDRAILAALDADADGLQLSDAQFHELDVTEPLADVALGKEVQRLVVRVRDGADPLGVVEIPVFGDTALAWHLADVLADQLGWILLGRFLEREVRPGLAEEPERDTLTWELFLRELWGTRELPLGDFYRPDATVAETGAGVLTDDGMDVAAPLPSLPPGELLVPVRCGGELLGTITVRADAPRTPHALRSAIVWQIGYELCIAAARIALLGNPSGTLRERLAAAAAVRVATAPERPAALRVGAAGTAALGGPRRRRGVLPADLADAVAELAGLEGRPVAVGDGNVVLVDPSLVGAVPEPLAEPNAAAAVAPDVALVHRHDPWAADSDYERVKREQTLALAPEHVDHALELACGAGTLTAELASRTGALLAVDASPEALDQASLRLDGRDDDAVDLARLDPFTDPLERRSADLIVCNDLLPYAGTLERLRFALWQIAGALTPGGALVTVNPRLLADEDQGLTWALPFGSATITRQLHETFLRLAAEVETDGYRVQRWVRPTSRWDAHRPRRVRRARADLPEDLPPAVAEMLREGAVAPGPAPTTPAEHVPVLAYHRVAAEGAEFNAEWRVHPAQFEAHLAHLRGQGYTSVTAAELSASMRDRTPLLGRPIIITFDDAYADFPDHAWPLLRKYGFSATIFAVADCTGGHNAWDAHRGERLELMGWDALRRLQAEGAEIGSHTAAHPPLSALTPAEIAADLVRSRLRMGHELGAPPLSLAYPFGDYDDVVKRVAGAAGFTIAFTCEARVARVDDAPLAAPRIEITGRDDVRAMTARLAAALR
jgi:glycosyltransferase involved in cell wall biosynthesis/peptidoglycan/xylan/chitin deacetylase (PgdA/CDA1 family)/SAM-dependent methyltransferase